MGGGWLLLPVSTSVVVGRFVEQKPAIEFRGSLSDLWTLEVTQVLLGNAIEPGDRVGVLSSVAEDRLGEIQSEYPWPRGRDAIVFLRALDRGSFDDPTPVYRIAADFAVIWEGLDKWTAAIPDGIGLLDFNMSIRAVSDLEARESAIAEKDALMDELIHEHGPIPLDLVFEDPAADNARRTEILLSIQRQPLTVAVGEVQIIFDQWFFSTFDPEARVTVLGPDGVLTEGLVSGPDAVMREIPDIGMAFYAEDGTEVARITYTELTDATNDAACDAGVTC
jgi:hypothetical protein